MFVRLGTIQCRIVIIMASGDSVQQIKDRLSIVDVISSYVELHQAGKSFKGKSPFTSEKTPSFYVSPDRGMYYCFSSSQGGDMFTFIEKMEGVDFKGALKLLAEKAGVELVPEDPKKRTERDTQYSILEEATGFFESELGKHSEAMDYLLSRGVTKETISKWRIGYVPGPPKNGWRHTRDFLRSKNFVDADIQRAGLIKQAGEGKEPYDVFRDRIMFPIMDPSGRVVGYSGRVLEKGSEAPKYVNSPETELFNKSEVLFGYDKAKQGIRHYDFSLIVEGQFDVVLAHQAGYTSAVAVSGTALTALHVGLLQRLSNRVVLALDADRAGISAVKRAADVMLSRGIDLKVASLPEGKDPADIIQADPAEFKKIIGHATHVIQFLLQVIKDESKDERTFKLRARDEILPYLLKMDSFIDREHFIDIIATSLGTTKDAILLEVARLESIKKVEPAQSQPESVEVSEVKAKLNNRKESIMNYLVVVHDLLSDQEKTILAKAFEEIHNTTLEEVAKQLTPEMISGLTFTLEQEFEQMSPHSRQIELVEKLREFSSLSLKEAMRKEQIMLKAAEQNQDEENLKISMENINALHKKLSEVGLPDDLFDISKS